MELFSINNVKKTSAFLNINNKKNQFDFYRENNSSEDILKIVKMSNKAFGETTQKIIMELLNLTRSNNTGHDACLNDKKFEIKSSRYWINKKDFRWQHIMENHDYDYIILIGVDFNKLLVYIISKKKFLELKDKSIGKTKIVTQQGGGEGQGLWACRNDIINYIREIRSITELQEYINDN